MHFILKCPKIEDFHFRLIFHFETSHVFFFEMPRLFMFEFFEMPHLSHFQSRNEPKTKVFDFGAFQNKMHMASHAKYIFHILFGAFHGTPRI